jgi:hypothetical protein
MFGGRTVMESCRPWADSACGCAISHTGNPPGRTAQPQPPDSTALTSTQATGSGWSSSRTGAAASVAFQLPIPLRDWLPAAAEVRIRNTTAEAVYVAVARNRGNLVSEGVVGHEIGPVVCHTTSSRREERRKDVQDFQGKWAPSRGRSPTHEVSVSASGLPNRDGNLMGDWPCNCSSPHFWVPCC